MNMSCRTCDLTNSSSGRHGDASCKGMLGLGNEWGTKSRFALVCMEKMSTPGVVIPLNPEEMGIGDEPFGKSILFRTTCSVSCFFAAMQRFDVFFFRFLKMYSTNI